jgi:hypothetical protein
MAAGPASGAGETADWRKAHDGLKSQRVVLMAGKKEVGRLLSLSVRHACMRAMRAHADSPAHAPAHALEATAA